MINSPSIETGKANILWKDANGDAHKLPCEIEEIIKFISGLNLDIDHLPGLIIESNAFLTKLESELKPLNFNQKDLRHLVALEISLINQESNFQYLQHHINNLSKAIETNVRILNAFKTCLNRLISFQNTNQNNILYQIIAFNEIKHQTLQQNINNAQSQLNYLNSLQTTTFPVTSQHININKLLTYDRSSENNLDEVYSSTLINLKRKLKLGSFIIAFCMLMMVYCAIALNTNIYIDNSLIQTLLNPYIEPNQTNFIKLVIHALALLLLTFGLFIFATNNNKDGEYVLGATTMLASSLFCINIFISESITKEIVKNFDNMGGYVIFLPYYHSLTLIAIFLLVSTGIFIQHSYYKIKSIKYYYKILQDLRLEQTHKIEPK